MGNNNTSKNKRVRLKVSAFVAVAVFLCFLSALSKTYAPKAEMSRNDPPRCEVYPITTSKNITGSLRFTNPERIISAKLYIYEATQNRLLYEEELPEEVYMSGSYTIPEMSFYSDYVKHFEEYTGFGKKGDYQQEMKVKLTYDTGNEGIKARTFSNLSTEDSLYKVQKASKKHGSLLVTPGYITEILHTPENAVRISECFVEQPDRVRRDGQVSVRVTIDGQELKTKPHAEKINYTLFVVRIPIPEGMTEDKSHTIEIYITQYIDGFRKGLEFLTIDTF